MLAFRLARRELRGGVRGLWVVLFCLALGVGTIAAVGTLRASIDAGLATNGRQILGGDLEIDSGSRVLTPEAIDWVRNRAETLSQVVQMRSMLIAPNGERQLIELKAVDQSWPLVGAARVHPEQSVADALGERNGQFGLLAERVILDRMGLRPGDTVRLGSATMRVAGELAVEPDRVATPSLFGARALISVAALPATELIAPGSMLRHALRLTLRTPEDAPRIAANIRAAFPNQGWRMRDQRDAAPAVVRFIDQTSLFLTLVGLTSLLVGGIGVANGVRAWIDARARSIATLRCLGASSRLIFALCLIQVMALSAVGISMGLIAGAALPLVGAGLLRDMLPTPPVLGVYAWPLVLAGSYGLLTALCFALWPLGRAARIPGAALFRDGLLPDRIAPSRKVIAVNAIVAALLIGLTVATANNRLFALYFCGAAAATLILFRVGAAGLMRLARIAPRSNAPWARLGIANLHRPGTSTPLLMLSVGLGLSTLTAVALIQGNMRREIQENMPNNAPSFFFVDIQNDQLARFAALTRSETGVSDYRHVPSMRARIVAVNGVPAEQATTTPETAWALRGDRGLTYAATPPPGTRLTAGQWWPSDYSGPPLVSFDAGLASGWGVDIGDTITVNVLGRDVVLRVANLRDIAWQSLSINFVMVASPGLLSGAPHTHIATVRVDGPSQGAFLRTVTDALPNVTGIRVEDVLATIAALLDQVAAALTATGALTLVAGGMVLVGAVAAGQRRRTRESVILKTLGATRGQIRAAWLVEFGALGLTAGAIAAVVGTGASFGVAHYILHTQWVFLPGTLIITIAGALATMLIFGYAGTAVALRARPAPLLRNE